MKKLILILLSILTLSSCNNKKKLGPQDFIEAFDDHENFKERFFKEYEQDITYTPEKVSVKGIEYMLYKTLNDEIPFILISDKAITVGMYGNLYKSYYDGFYELLNKDCIVTMKNNPQFGLYDYWDCPSCNWMIQSTEANGSGGVFFITKKIK